MIGTSCNTKNCPNAYTAILVGIGMILIVMFTFLNDAHAGVRVEITRELPEEIQTIIQTFEDDEDFQMWMGMKMEGEGCDPYVTDMRIIRNWYPDEQLIGDLE